MAPKTDPDVARYEQLVSMIEAELELLRAQNFAELELAVKDRGELLATLPATPPPAAAEQFERARILHEQVIAATTQRRDQLKESLVKLRNVRHAAEGYRPPRRQKYSTTA